MRKNLEDLFENRDPVLNCVGIIKRINECGYLSGFCVDSSLKIFLVRELQEMWVLKILRYPSDF